jgi:lipopolysaccharide transport system ATP-binding protein
VSKGEGRTVLFVSHNMDSLRKLCTKGLVLKQGAIHYSGDIVSSINHYLEAYFDKQQTSWVKKDNKKDAPEITFTGMQLLDGNLQPVSTEVFSNTDKLFLQIRFDCHEIASNITIGYWLFNDAGVPLYQSEQSDADAQINRRMTLGDNSLIAEVNIAILKTGKYRLALSSSVKNVKWIVSPTQEVERILSFDIVNESVSCAREVMIAPSIQWNLKKQ